MRRKKWRTLSFASELIEAIEVVIKNTGYKNPTDYATHKLRNSVNEDIKKFKDKKKIKKRLKSLGYKVK